MIKHLRKHTLYSVFASEVLILNTLVFIVYSFSYDLYSVLLLALLILTHLFCLLNSKLREVISYRLILAFSEILWVLYYYNDFSFFLKINTFLIIFLYVFSFLFWLPFNQFLDNESNINSDLSENQTSYVSSRL